MAPTAAYDGIVEQYGAERRGTERYGGDLPGRRRSRTGPGDDSPLAPVLPDLLGEGSGVCLEIAPGSPGPGGTGPGLHTAAVRSLGWSPLGIALPPGTPRPFRGRPPVVRADAGRLPLPDASVPAAVATLLRTDPPGLPAVLREAARVLRPGGVFVHIGTHPCHCGGRTDRAARCPADVPHHSLPELLHAFLDAGLALERFAESGTPTPSVLAVGARKNG
ncbi:MAG TPA: methyltransferase domain-containing protein [Streptomyces sp.]|nr:methyltransferase domain-containing protein [Streptomyces sp.]